MLNALRNGGNVLYCQIPSEFLPWVVEIVSYSFCEDQVGFDSFLKSFKGCDKHYDKLLSSDFEGLLKNLRDRAYNMAAKFFGDLTHCIAHHTLHIPQAAAKVFPTDVAGTASGLKYAALATTFVTIVSINC